MQTTVTAFAGLAFAIYAHYKKRQVYIENLMRSIVYAPAWDDSLLVSVLKEMERIDSGFGFAQALSKTKTDKDAEDKARDSAKAKESSPSTNSKKSTDED